MNLESGAGKQFEICNESEISLLINNSIVDNLTKPGCSSFEIDSLRRIYSQDSIQVSIYKVDAKTNISTSLLFPALGYTPEVNPIEVREVNNLSNFILFVLVILGVVALSIREWNYKYFEEFSSISKIFSLRIRSSPIYMTKPYSREVFLMILFQSLTISFLIISISDFFPEDSVFYLSVSSSFWGIVGQWVLMSISFVVVLYIQFVVLSLTNLFFRNPKIVHIQFYDNLRIIHFYLVILALVILILFAISYTWFTWFLSYLWFITAFMFLVKSVVIYLKMINESEHRKLHIFSYFCATEILPFALLVKIVFY